jgi:hypothetical protein
MVGMARTPAALVGVVLRESRQRGIEFEAAWMLAVRSLPRSQPDILEWRAALAAVKPYWRAAYQGEASRANVPALSLSGAGWLALSERVREGVADEHTLAL